MELLIPGLILVALMVYASTRIKRTAAAAFNAETVETDEFVIQKPEGFLNVIGPAAPYVFEAYSKEFSKERPEMRVGTVTVAKLNGRAMADVVEEMHAEKFIDQGSEVLDERHYRDLSIEGSPDVIDIARFAKLCDANGAVYRLEVVTPQESSGDQWVETFIDTFRVK